MASEEGKIVVDSGKGDSERDKLQEEFDAHYSLRDIDIRVRQRHASERHERSDDCCPDCNLRKISLLKARVFENTGTTFDDVIRPKAMRIAVKIFTRVMRMMNTTHTASRHYYRIHDNMLVDYEKMKSEEDWLKKDIADLRVLVVENHAKHHRFAAFGVRMPRYIRRAIEYGDEFDADIVVDHLIRDEMYQVSGSLIVHSQSESDSIFGQKDERAASLH